MSILLKLRKDSKLVKKLRKPLEEAVYTMALLKKFSSYDLSTLDKRIVCQKIVYFANRLELSPQYCFNLYVHGPYSPDLANDLFLLADKSKEIQQTDFILNESEVAFQKLDVIVSKRSPKMLEIIATLDFLHNNGHTTEQAKKRTKELKGASDIELSQAINVLKGVSLWSAK